MKITNIISEVYSNFYNLVHQRFYSKDDVDGIMDDLTDEITDISMVKVNTIDSISDGESRPVTSNKVYDAIDSHNGDTSKHNGKLDKSSIVDNLESSSGSSPLSAKQGKVLNDKLDDLVVFFNGTE